jgi:hypothetical protein
LEGGGRERRFLQGPEEVERMRWLFLTLMVVHGLIHFMGAARAFGFAELSQLTQPISRGMGAVWLAAGFGMLLAAASLVALPRFWWLVAGVAAVLSQIAIVSSWTDAKVGTIANVLILAGAVYGLASQGPASFRSAYEGEVRARLAEADAPEPPPVTEDDLAHLPEPVQRYLRVTGSVGQPRIRHFRARWRGRIRSSPSDPWMSFTAEQFNVMDDPARFFLMDARRSGLPVDVYHVFTDAAAGMRVRLLSLLPVTRSAGADFTRAETVTIFNDLCLLAPAALIDPTIRWEPLDARSARAHFTLGDNTVSATLTFNDDGELVNFVSDDRLATSTDGSQLTPVRFSTPVRAYRTFGARRVVAGGEGRWHPPEGEFSYIELELLEYEANGRSVR